LCDGLDPLPEAAYERFARVRCTDRAGFNEPRSLPQVWKAWEMRGDETQLGINGTDSQSAGALAGARRFCYFGGQEKGHRLKSGPASDEDGGSLRFGGVVGTLAD
jgi:hypothetical protein